MAFSLVPAAYLVLRRDDAVLLQLRQNTGYKDGHWASLAGHIEPGESAYAAAVREAYEESGVRIDVRDLTPLTTYHRTRPGGPVEQRVDFFFETWAWSGEPELREPAKCAEMRWFPLGGLPDPIPAHERVVLESLARGEFPPPVLTLGFS